MIDHGLNCNGIIQTFLLVAAWLDGMRKPKWQLVRQKCKVSRCQLWCQRRAQDQFDWLMLSHNILDFTAKYNPDKILYGLLCIAEYLHISCFQRKWLRLMVYLVQTNASALTESLHTLHNFYTHLSC